MDSAATGTDPGWVQKRNVHLAVLWTQEGVLSIQWGWREGPDAPANLGGRAMKEGTRVGLELRKTLVFMSAEFVALSCKPGNNGKKTQAPDIAPV